MIKATLSSGSGWGALSVWSSPATALLGQVISSSLPGLFFPFHSPTPCREPSAHSLCNFPCSGPSERICPSLKSFLVFLLAWDSSWIKTDNWFPPTESFTFINPKSICLLALRKVRSFSGGSQQSHPWGTCILFCHKEQRRFFISCDCHSADDSRHRAWLSLNVLFLAGGNKDMKEQKWLKMFLIAKFSI